MAVLSESSVWPNGIMQIETGDPVQGGSSGISNIPHRELANRTTYLKTELESHIADTDDPHEAAGYAKSSDLQAHLDESDDPHEAAGYAKDADFDAHVANTDDPHEAAAYLKEATYTSHVFDDIDPHMAAGYAKEEYVDTISNIINTHLEDPTPHQQAGFATTAYVDTKDDAHIEAHENAYNPHSQYALSTYVDAQVDAHIEAHESDNDPHPQYNQPIATANTLGVVRIGSGLTIDAPTGVLSSETAAIATTETLGVIRVGSGLTINEETGVLSATNTTRMVGGSYDGSLMASVGIASATHTQTTGTIHPGGSATTIWDVTFTFQTPFASTSYVAVASGAGFIDQGGDNPDDICPVWVTNKTTTSVTVRAPRFGTWTTAPPNDVVSIMVIGL